MNIFRIVYVHVFSALAAVGLLSSCQEDVCMTQQSEHTVGFYAGGSQTRTSMLPDGLSSIWTEGDQLSLWALNSSGSYTLSNQIFKAYGLDAGRGFFTSTLSEHMPEDTYSYIACYPAPVSVSGSKVTFNLPSVQDGKASSGADIMISDPVQYGPLTAIPEPEDHSGLRMRMNHMMHQFRFFVPEDDQLLGDEKIERILLTFPKGVTGNVTLDVEDPDGPVELTDNQAEVELRLAEPIGVSSGDDYEFACLAFAPVQFDEGQVLQLKAYTDDKIVFIDPVDLKAKSCASGHSTPVKLRICDVADYAGIIYLNLVTNNLGENPKKITLTAPEGCNWGDGGSNVFVYDPGREIQTGETLAFKFETDESAYTAFSGQPIDILYDSENALLSERLTMPVITGRGMTSLSMTVPYLLFEDFSCIHTEGESYGNNSYSSSEREQPGKSLDSYMSHKGWNAARFWMKAGTCVRINTRYQEVKILFTFASTHYGRLDTPQLSGLKDGKSVNLSVIFDAGGNKHSESSLDVLSPSIAVATHSNTGVLNGIPTGTAGLGSNYDTTLADFGTTHEDIPIEDNCGNDAFSSTFTTRTATVNMANCTNRICFYVKYTSKSGIGNNEFNVYIDNIRVKIAK